MSNRKVQNIDEYISDFPQEIQNVLKKLRNFIKEEIPEATEKISWNMPTFYWKGNLVHFAAFKNHIGFYPTDTAITKFQEELKNYETTKGSIHFNFKDPLPSDLIKEIVKFRKKENESKNLK